MSSDENSGDEKGGSAKTFKCPRCKKLFSYRSGVVIKECSHRFCKGCLVGHCRYSATKYSSVRCPNNPCNSTFNDKEIKELLGDKFHEYSLKLLQRLKSDYTKNNKSDSDEPRPRQNNRDEKFQRPTVGFKKPSDFNCSKCDQKTKENDGFKVERCSHSFCKKCLIKHCMYSATKYAEVRCLNEFCKNILEDGEVHKLLGNDYGLYASKVMSILRATKTEDKSGGSRSRDDARGNGDFNSRRHNNQADVSGEVIDCSNCGKSTTKRDGFQIENCLHSFCSKCFTIYCFLGLTKDSKVECPFKYCKNIMNEDEIKKLLGGCCDEDQFKEIRKLRAALTEFLEGAVGFSEMKEAQGEIFGRPKNSSRKPILSENYRESRIAANNMTRQTIQANPIAPLKCTRCCETAMEPLGLDAKNFNKLVTPDKTQEVARKNIEQLIDHNIQEMKCSEKSFALVRDDIEKYDAFLCKICYVDTANCDGIVLEKCQHKFCKECLIASVQHAEEFEVKCPNNDPVEGNCKEFLTETEIRSVVPDEIYGKHLKKSQKLHETTLPQAVRCKDCKAIDQGKNCQQYQVDNNEAMYCPRCGIPVIKNDGCDYITCTACKLEICWVTKKPRKPIA